MFCFQKQVTMNQFTKILVVILFGLFGWNGIQVFGAFPETEVSYTRLTDSSSNDVCQESSSQVLKQHPEGVRLNQQLCRSWTFESLRPQDFLMRNLSVCWNGQSKPVPFHPMDNNCFSGYKTFMSSETSGKSACSSYHCVSVSGRSIVFEQRKIII